MTDVKWLEVARDSYCGLQSKDKKMIKKINELIKDAQRNPFYGLGKPERLKSANAWSRRIDDKNRLVYSVENDCIVINGCMNHYNDK